MEIFPQLVYPFVLLIVIAGIVSFLGYFIVPKAQMQDGQNPKSFRDRINQAVRTYKQRVNKTAHLEPGYDEATYVPVDFTVLTLGAPPEDQPDAWEEGDVGVWRDS